jgi:hypothetical protein
VEFSSAASPRFRGVTRSIFTPASTRLHDYTIYCKWLKKDFMEAGKARMRGDTLREGH